ncbi:MAG: hypothetical protein IPM56_04565 [Ignavibacteriales bacterium]|nr:MAG: hypothetical protein IPM56_04565 [Ignavibacteriales bacterium]
MSLFKDKALDKRYSYFYLRIPPHFPFDPQNLFAEYKIAKTFAPAVLKLLHVEGDE